MATRSYFESGPTRTHQPPNHHATPSSLFLPFESHPGPMLRRWRPFLRPHGALKIGVLSTALILSSLIVYITFLLLHSSSSRPSDWQAISYFDPNSLDDLSETLLLDTRLASLPKPTPVLVEPPPPSPSASPVSDVLTLEQIRDIVTPTRGFFSRDYSLGLGWNNVSAIPLN